MFVTIVGFAKQATLAHKHERGSRERETEEGGVFFRRFVLSQRAGSNSSHWQVGSARSSMLRSGREANRQTVSCGAYNTGCSDRLDYATLSRVEVSVLCVLRVSPSV